jgi:flagellar basal-body rod protein FlgG
MTDDQGGQFVMINSLYTSASGMAAQQFNIDTISNNLANANTNGYKSVRPEFQDLLYLNLQQPVTLRQNSPLEVGMGVRPVASQTNFDQGNLVSTGNPLDMAISGDGFFTVSPDHQGASQFFTRDGSFKQDEAGNLVTAGGYYVLSDQGKNINIPGNATDIAVSQDGQITFALPGQQTAVQAGRVGVAQFNNPLGLKHAGQNLFQTSDNSGAPTPVVNDNFSIEQNHLESSNVQMVEEMVNMITAQRAYELNSKGVQASDNILGIINNLHR